MKFFFITALIILIFLTGCATYPPHRQEISRDGRFIAYSSGVVKDTKTDLEWIAGS